MAQKRSHHDVTALSPVSLGPKSAQKGLEKRNQLRGFGLRASPPKSEIRPCSIRSQILVAWRAWCGPGAGLVRAWCGPGAGLVGPVRAWCGPGAGLAILGWAQDCSFNPAVGAGLLHSILSSAQDCPGALPAARAWSCSCPSTAL